MADDNCPGCGTGLDGSEDAWPWCDLCWEAQRAGASGLDVETVKSNIVNDVVNSPLRHETAMCELAGCPNEADATLEVRAGRPIRLKVCLGHADDLEAGLDSGSWRISDGADEPVVASSAA